MAFLDIKTILTLTALTLFAVAGAMSLVMGRQLSPAASAARGSLIAQAGGWTAIVAAEFVWDMPLSVLAIACGSAANLLMFTALEQQRNALRDAHSRERSLGAFAQRIMDTVGGVVIALDAQGRRYTVSFLINHPRASAGGPAIDALLLWVAQRRPGEAAPQLENE